MKRSDLCRFVLFSMLLSSCNCRPYCAPCDVVEESYVHKYGIQVSPDDWASRGEDGRVISKLKNGVIVSRNYVRGQLDGECTYSFAHSDQVEKRETYAQGTLTKELYYTRSGEPLREIRHLGPEHKGIIEWYQDGAPKSKEELNNAFLVEAEYYNPAHQVESRVLDGSGIRMSRDRYGQLLSQDRIENGALAEVTFFHPNGSPKEIIPYTNGQIEGKKKTYMPDGEPIAVETWQAGIQTGLSMLYQNGEVYAEVPYRNGQKNGTERRYRDGNIVVQEISWADNQYHGPLVNYVGDSPKTDYYYQGEHVTKTKFDILSSLTLDKK